MIENSPHESKQMLEENHIEPPPVEVPTSEIIDKIIDRVIGDEKLKVREITSVVSILSKRVHNILNRKKLFVKLVRDFSLLTEIEIM